MPSKMCSPSNTSNELRLARGESPLGLDHSAPLIRLAAAWPASDQDTLLWLARRIFHVQRTRCAPTWRARRRSGLMTHALSPPPAIPRALRCRSTAAPRTIPAGAHALPRVAAPRPIRRTCSRREFAGPAIANGTGAYAHQLTSAYACGLIIKSLCAPTCDRASAARARGQRVTRSPPPRPPASPSPSPPLRRYEIRDVDGVVVAVHVRIDRVQRRQALTWRAQRPVHPGRVRGRRSTRCTASTTSPRSRRMPRSS